MIAYKNKLHILCVFLELFYFCKNKDVQVFIKLNPTVLSNLKFYMNKKHIDHRGVNNDVQTKLKNISLVACKYMFQSIKQNNEYTNTLITHVTYPDIIVIISFCCLFDFIFLPNKLTIHH